MAGKNRAVCGWRTGAAPCEQAVAGHLQGCADCSVGRAGTAGDEESSARGRQALHARRRNSMPACIKQMPSEEKRRPWLKASAIAAQRSCCRRLLLCLVSRPRILKNAVVAQLVDQHVIMLASVQSGGCSFRGQAHGEAVVSGQDCRLRSTRRSWQRFSHFTLIGGKLVYAQHAPGAELVYQVRQHKISVFIFQARMCMASLLPATRRLL